MNLSFRQKIFITYVVVFLVFLALIFPFSSRSVKQIVVNAMEERSSELIAKIDTASNNEALIRRLKEQKSGIFFRVSVITDEKKILYDSHTKRLLGPQFDQNYIVDHPEVTKAFQTGRGYQEAYSNLLSQRFVYIAKTFDFHGKTYVLRTAFPYQYVVEMTHDFEIGFLMLATITLLLFSIMTWFIINHLTSPISQIIASIRPYQEGTEAWLPHKLAPWLLHRKDEFGKLAETLNSLSMRVQSQISRISHERNEKQAVLESLVEGVVAVEPDMTIIYANQAALEILSFDGENLIGESFAVTNQQKCYALLKDCQNENRPITDTMTLKNNGDKIYLDLVANPIQGGLGAVLVLQDRTSQYKMMEMRKEFVANASHELKTPITVIQGFAETLHDNPHLPEATLKEITYKIVKRSQGMTVLIKDLLTLADIEHIPEHRFVKSNLVDLIEASCHHVREAFPEAKITTECDPEEQYILDVDPSLFQLAISNLVENGVKYSKEPAEVVVRLIKRKREITIDVADHGIGIPKDDLDHIFDRFYTVNKAESRKKGGSGLGLSIVSTIIKKHGGSTTVSSTLGEGTTFHISLPT